MTSAIGPLRLPAWWMRGGTSKGLFLRRADLPTESAQGPALDQLLLRLLGSPDRYGTQIDGLGGGTSSTSKVIIANRSARPGCDIDYQFAQIDIRQARVDWSGNCGNLTTAVAPFALHAGLIGLPTEQLADQTTVHPTDPALTQFTVRLWQQNIGKIITASVPIQAGQVCENSDFIEDGVAFASAAIRLTFNDAGGSEEAPLLPTGRVCDTLVIPGVGSLAVSLINAGNPTAFITAASLNALGLAGVSGMTATALPLAFNQRTEWLALCETIRAHAAVAMGLARTPADATTNRPATPRLALLSPPETYTDSTGRTIEAASIQLNARIISMGQLHHAFTGTGAVALAVAAALPGSIVAQCCSADVASVGGDVSLCFGHPSGRLRVGARVSLGAQASEVRVEQVVLERSARRLMEGVVFVH